ncbi:MAG: class I SAM-dependent methyltransferase [Phycisphaerales bacterium]
MAIARNAYRRAWFDTFARSVDGGVTAREVAFLERLLPRDAFPHILDLACGAGRHADALAHRGYRVLGVDRDQTELDRAPHGPGCADYRRLDMRDLAGLADAPFDACICLWQSFGSFEDDANDAVLGDIASLLRPGGRLLLDVYDRDFFDGPEVTRRFERAGRWVTEHRWVDGDRLRVHLALDGGPLLDVFEWRVFSPDELADLCAQSGLREILRCARFDERTPPSADEARMQMCFEKA